MLPLRLAYSPPCSSASPFDRPSCEAAAPFLRPFCTSFRSWARGFAPSATSFTADCAPTSPTPLSAARFLPCQSRVAAFSPPSDTAPPLTSRTGVSVPCSMQIDGRGPLRASCASCAPPPQRARGLPPSELPSLSASCSWTTGSVERKRGARADIAVIGAPPGASGDPLLPSRPGISFRLPETPLCVAVSTDTDHPKESF